MPALKRIVLALMLLFALVLPTVARADVASVQTTWRLLDYIAVDYRGAVQDGRIISELEYDEMREFTASVTERLGALPDHPAKTELIAAARQLQAEVLRRAPPPEVERRARDLGERLLAAYPVPMAPTAVPDLARGQALYAAHCASCHGTDGAARTETAAALEPPPIDFTDRARARDRSLFALYQVTSQGLEDTAMQSFAQLPVEDRWALVAYVGRFAYPPDLAAQGEPIWRD
ncbi:MAG: c-type cytochrome, partial [Allosphingosinicella sp.]